VAERVVADQAANRAPEAVRLDRVEGGLIEVHGSATVLHCELACAFGCEMVVSALINTVSPTFRTLVTRDKLSQLGI
jgi:hypothetical protein